MTSAAIPARPSRSQALDDLIMGVSEMTLSLQFIISKKGRGARWHYVKEIIITASDFFY